MEKYKKVEKPKQDVEIKENEIRITTQGKNAQLHFLCNWPLP